MGRILGLYQSGLFSWGTEVTSKKNIDTIKHALAINIGEHQLFSMTRAFVVDRFSGSAWSPGVQSGTSLQAPPVPKVWQVAS